jgi:hypothetical protein
MSLILVGVVSRNEEEEDENLCREKLSLVCNSEGNEHKNEEMSSSVRTET